MVFNGNLSKWGERTINVETMFRKSFSEPLSASSLLTPWHKLISATLKSTSLRMCERGSNSTTIGFRKANKKHFFSSSLSSIQLKRNWHWIISIDGEQFNGLYQLMEGRFFFVVLRVFVAIILICDTCLISFGGQCCVKNDAQSERPFSSPRIVINDCCCYSLLLNFLFDVDFSGWTKLHVIMHTHSPCIRILLIYVDAHSMCR